MLLVYLAVLGLTGLWFWQQSKEGWSFRSTGMTWPILFFVAVAFLSCVTSIDLSRSLFGAYRSYVYGSIPMTAFALLFYLTTQIDNPAVVRGVTTGHFTLRRFSGTLWTDAIQRSRDIGSDAARGRRPGVEQLGEIRFILARSV